MSEIQAIYIAAIASLSMWIWARWMRSPGEEWAITKWVRERWQCVTGYREGWQKCKRRLRVYQ